MAKVGAAGGEESLTVLSTSAADSGNQFRVSSGQYVYNLSTKGWGEGVYVLKLFRGQVTQTLQVHPKFYRVVRSEVRGVPG